MVTLGNPFKERATDRTTSDKAFVRLFSPRILENLPESAFKGGVHLFVSPPGGGKTTLCRAFTPSALQSFWNAKDLPEMKESAKVLQELGVLDPTDGPQMLGVQLTCLSGYADLPSGMSLQHDGLFRALLNCRIVLRALRSLATMVNANSIEQLTDIKLEYPGELQDLTAIPQESSPIRLAQWAEQCERGVYSHLDALSEDDPTDAMPTHVRFEGVLWLQGIKFIQNNKELVPRRLLMIDDLQALRRKQREMLKREFLDLRPKESIWLAQRTSALKEEEVLSVGARQGRDVDIHSLESLLGSGRNGFSSFAQNVLDRRFETQNLFPKAKFEQYLKVDTPPQEVAKAFQVGVEKYRENVTRFRSVTQYQDWIAAADQLCNKTNPTTEDLRSLYTTRILIARNESKRQLSFIPLAAEEIEERDSSATQGAADIFAHYETSLPYYFGMDVLCSLATNNIEELLGLAASLYDGLEANQMLRRSDASLTTREQEKLLTDTAKKKREFIPRSHAEGTRARSLIDAIGSYCREKTFTPTASYPPGVTGVRLSLTELEKLMVQDGPTNMVNTLRKVLSECVADNLLFIRASSATTGREEGQIFYLNRTICAYFGLPLTLGGWQDVKVTELFEWMQLGRKLAPRNLDL